MEFWECTVEGMEIDKALWKGRKVLVTGHTGFKGSWLSLWLHKLGARVFGFALPAPTSPSHFDLTGIGNSITSIIGDIRDLDLLYSVIAQHRPEIIFHLAAQSLVRESYKDPVATYATNVMGTVNLLEATRRADSTRAIVNITTDKCYENKEWVWKYREIDALGGYDPYSSSKACAELVTSSFRSSFFSKASSAQDWPALASARAGNVIGGGDWAKDRLVPDVIAAFRKGRAATIRSPEAVRPWQHVLDVLHGYLILAQRLFGEGKTFSSPWNFGPDDHDIKPVSWIATHLADRWNRGAKWVPDTKTHAHEAKSLKLDSAKARSYLGWKPKLCLSEALEWTVTWYEDLDKGMPARKITESQISKFEEKRDKNVS
jgi:CDP-glucose 4,6-dehydratase